MVVLLMAVSNARIQPGYGPLTGGGHTPNVVFRGPGECENAEGSATTKGAQQYLPDRNGPMNKTSALRPLAALATSSLLLCTVVLAASADETREQTVAGAVGAASCKPLLPDHPATGINLGPLFQRAV